MGGRSSRDTSDDLLSQSPKSKAFTRRFNMGHPLLIHHLDNTSVLFGQGFKWWYSMTLGWQCKSFQEKQNMEEKNCFFGNCGNDFFDIRVLCGQVTGVSLGWFWWEVGQLTKGLHYWHKLTMLLDRPFSQVQLVSNIMIQIAISPAYTPFAPPPPPHHHHHRHHHLQQQQPSDQPKLWYGYLNIPHKIQTN